MLSLLSLLWNYFRRDYSPWIRVFLRFRNAFHSNNHPNQHWHSLHTPSWKHGTCKHFLLFSRNKKARRMNPTCGEVHRMLAELQTLGNPPDEVMAKAGGAWCLSWSVCLSWLVPLWCGNSTALARRKKGGAKQKPFGHVRTFGVWFPGLLLVVLVVVVVVVVVVLAVEQMSPYS